MMIKFNDEIIDAEISKANRQSKPLFLLIIATKPCYIKLASLIIELKKNNLPSLIIDSGQHFDDVLVNAQNEFDYKETISIYLNIRGNLTERNISLINKINLLKSYLYTEKKLIKDAIPLVSGDTLTAGFFPIFWYLETGIKSIHIEAGLRSYQPDIDWNIPENQSSETIFNQHKVTWKKNVDHPFPEGLDSRLATQCSQLYFAPVELNKTNLVEESFNSKDIVKTGSLSKDALDLILKKNVETSVFSYYPFLSENKWLRVDVHRRENLTYEKIIAILEGLDYFLTNGGNVVLILTNSFNAAIKHHMLENKLREFEQKSNFRMTALWSDYLNVIEFIQSENCIGLYTDSGGLQEEANILSIKCATCRYSTDRPETVFNQTNILIPPVNGTFVGENLVNIFLKNKFNFKKDPLYGNQVSKKIVSTLENYSIKERVINYNLNY